MTYTIFRGDPSLSPPPSDIATITVALAQDDRSIVSIGVKMFSSSDVSVVSRSNQERLVGRRSFGRFGDVARSQPSHGKSINVPFDGTEIPDDIFKGLDQYTQDTIADLVFRRILIVTTDNDRTNTGAWLTPPAIRVI